MSKVNAGIKRERGEVSWVNALARTLTEYVLVTRLARTSLPPHINTPYPSLSPSIYLPPQLQDLIERHKVRPRLPAISWRSPADAVRNSRRPAQSRLPIHHSLRDGKWSECIRKPFISALYHKIIGNKTSWLFGLFVCFCFFREIAD